ncbi:hypothetical protein [Tissierella praeacuta]|uniref:hypothetical protein n=1 Tax=Tissierella praeacuta TaxID=43131 RepID=UPI0028A62CC1|nr:hypothetical protein [Tissierella praeacuta]
MKKRILLICLTLLLIVVVGCGKEGLNDNDNNQDSNKLGKIEEVEVVEVPDMKNKTIKVKREELGEFTSIRKMESENVSAENELIKITITDYKLEELKPNDEYKDYFKDFGIVNLDEISILDINFKFENLSNDILELDSLQGRLTTNTGEEVSVLLDFFEEKDKNKFKFFEKEVKKGSVSTVLNSNAKEIESFKLIYDDYIILESNFK